MLCMQANNLALLNSKQYLQHLAQSSTAQRRTVSAPNKQVLSISESYQSRLVELLWPLMHSCKQYNNEGHAQSP